MNSEATKFPGARPTWRCAALLAIAAIASLALQRVVAPLANSTPVASAPSNPAAMRAAVESGAGLAVLGGLRTLVANALWLRMYVGWERRDLAATDTFVRWATRIDSRPVYFWLNGARIVGYDLAAWRIEAAGGYDAVPGGLQEAIYREQAQRAVALLDEALCLHPASIDLWVERANLALNRLSDLALAVESYRRAAELPGAPYYVGRLYGEVLRRAGRHADALQWLVALHPTLPPGEDAAADLVLARIRELEAGLGITPDRAYAAPRAGEGKL